MPVPVSFVRAIAVVIVAALPALCQRRYATDIEFEPAALCSVASFFVKVKDRAGESHDVSVAVTEGENAAVIANNICSANAVKQSAMETCNWQIQEALAGALHACTQGRDYDVAGFACRKRKCSPTADGQTDPLTSWFDAHTAGRGIDKWRHYFSAYHAHLQQFRGKRPVILEIGINHGGSIDMWQKYFGEGTVLHGVDINPSCRQFEAKSAGVFIHTGDQGDRQFMEGLVAQVGPVDIIIDDGGHTMQQQLLTMQVWFPRVNDGGVYLVEDTHTSYFPDMGGGLRRNGTFIEHTKGLIDELHGFRMLRNGIPMQPNSETTNFTLSAESIHHYESMVVIQKRARPLDERSTWGGLYAEKKGDKYLHGVPCWWAGIHHCPEYPVLNAGLGESIAAGGAAAGEREDSKKTACQVAAAGGPQPVCGQEQERAGIEGKDVGKKITLEIDERTHTLQLWARRGAAETVRPLCEELALQSEDCEALAGHVGAHHRKLFGDA
jgi:cephalosporin hydroxylase